MIKTNTHHPASNIMLYLLIISIFILGEGAFGKAVTVAAILLSIAGLIVSGGITDNRKNRSVNIGIDIANIAVCVWIIMLIMQSSFIFEKIVFSFAKGIVFIIAILSFNPSYKRNSAYIQILTLLLFIVYPLLLKTNTLLYQLLSVVYIIIWITIIRISLRKRRYGSYREISKVVVSCILVMAIILPLAYILKSRIYFPKIKQLSSFLRTEKLNIDNQLYELQDKLYKDSKEFVNKYNPNASGNKQVMKLVNKKNEARGRILNLLSALFQESPYTLKVEKARSGLKDIFHRPGFGLEEGDKEALISTLKKYVNTKIRVNNLRKASELSNGIRSSLKNLKSKLSALMTINKVNYSSGIQEINRAFNSLNKLADSIANNENRNRIKKTIDELKRWKLYSIYNESRNRIEDAVKNTGKTSRNNGRQNKEYASNLLNAAENTTAPLGIARLIPKINALNTTSEGVKKETSAKISNWFRKMLEAKIELSLNENLERLIDKLTEELIPQQTIDRISKQIKNIINSESADTLLKETEALKDALRETETSKYVLNDIHTQNIIVGKTEALKNKEETKMNKLLNKSTLSEENKNQLIKSANNLFYSKYSTINDWENLDKSIEKLSRSGRIYKNTYEKLKNTLSNLRIISEVRRLPLEQEQKTNAENKGAWNELMKNVNNENTRNNLSSMMNELKSASHIQDINIAKDNLYAALDELEKGSNKDIYVPRKYQTRVSVLEGVVGVAPYDENGPRYEEEVILKSGESITVKGEAKIMRKQKDLITQKDAQILELVTQNINFQKARENIRQCLNQADQTLKNIKSIPNQIIIGKCDTVIVPAADNNISSINAIRLSYDQFKSDKNISNINNLISNNKTSEQITQLFIDYCTDQLKYIKNFTLMEAMETLGEKKGRGTEFIQEKIDHLFRLASPLWNFNRSRLNERRQLDYDHIINFGVYNADTDQNKLNPAINEVKNSYAIETDHSYSTTNEPHRIWLLNHAAALPAYFISNLEENREKYENEIKPTYHIDKFLEMNAPDLFPIHEIANKALRVLGMAIVPGIDVIHDKKLNKGHEFIFSDPDYMSQKNQNEPRIWYLFKQMQDDVVSEFNADETYNLYDYIQTALLKKVSSMNQEDLKKAIKEHIQKIKERTNKRDFTKLVSARMTYIEIKELELFLEPRGYGMDLNRYIEGNRIG